MCWNVREDCTTEFYPVIVSKIPVFCRLYVHPVKGFVRNGENNAQRTEAEKKLMTITIWERKQKIAQYRWKNNARKSYSKQK